MSERVLHVGVVGCGRIARNLHIPGYLGSAKAKLVAFYNHRLETVADLSEAHPDVRLYDDYERFLSDSGVRAISVCTPSALHAEMSVSALKRGIHVLVEKPMAVTLASARAMIDSAAESRALLMVGQTERYRPTYRKARELIQAGALGRIFQIRTACCYGSPLYGDGRGQWFATARLAGMGVIGDLAIHRADTIRFLTGEEVQQVAAFKGAFEMKEVEDNVVAVLQLSGGALVTLSASWTTRGGNIGDLLLVGERGSLRIGVETDAPFVFYKASGERVVYPVAHKMPRADGALQIDEIPEFVEAVLRERPNPIPAELHTGY